MPKSGAHKCNTATIQLQYKNFFLVLQLYCICADPCNTTLQYQFSFLQLAENLQATCSSCKKTCIAVVLHLCGPLNGEEPWNMLLMMAVVMMMMIVLAVTACRAAWCRGYEACVVGADGQATCQCPTEALCGNAEDQVICAANGQTYSNRCLLRVDECAANQLIRVLYRGACSHSPSGRRRRPYSQRRPARP